MCGRKLSCCDCGLAPWLKVPGSSVKQSESPEARLPEESRSRMDCSDSRSLMGEGHLRFRLAMAPTYGRSDILSASERQHMCT